MNYKKIIKSRKTRESILRFLSFIPDQGMIRFQYYIKMGRKLNLKVPERFTEKLQWYKLYYKDPKMVSCVDKADVREYVTECGLSYILTKCYGVYNSPNEIDFHKLPNRFVLKDTLGGGGNSVIIVENKNSLDLTKIKKNLQEWVEIPANVKSGGREWPYYSGNKHRIIIEEFIESSKENGGLIDYKFFCFDGKAQYLYVIADRTVGEGAGVGIYDMDYRKLPYVRCDERPLERAIPCPINFQEMIRCAEQLSRPFPHARVDLYNQNGKIIFGEITFFDGSGYMTFNPDEFDYILGEKFVLRPHNMQ